MFLRGAIRLRATARRKAVIGATIAAVLSVPAILFAFATDPPAAVTGGPNADCTSCHGSLGASNQVTVTFPSGSTTYTPGGAAESLTVTLLAGSGAFELAVMTTANGQAGTLTEGRVPI